MAASYSGRTRVASMSSIRRMNRPPSARAAAWAVRAEKAWPLCSRPVGEGAKRVVKAAGVIAAQHSPMAGLRIVMQVLRNPSIGSNV